MFSIDFPYVYNIIQSKNYYIIQVSVFKKMKKFLPLILLTGFSSPVLADITHRMTSSTQLITNAAATQVERIGSTYTVSGSGVTMDVGGGNSADNMVGGLGTLTDGVGQGSIATATQTSAGGAFSFSQTFVEGDVIATTAPSVGAVSPYSNQVSTAVGSGTGTGTVTSAHTVTAVGGGSGTSATAQFVTELTIQ
tara:strand:+ start:458 stop:1039 length:582 start_codon:yes stop_codon:yes gene_type:complete